MSKRFSSQVAIVTLVALGVLKLFELVAPVPESRAGQEVAFSGRTEEEQRTIEIYRKAKEAVVFIATVTLTVDPFDFFRGVQREEGSGTGVIVDAQKGLVLTNLHVIKDAANIKITLSDQRHYGARLLGYDQEYDVAVLKLIDPPANLTSIPWGDSSRLDVGQQVLAIGNPFGLSSTLTSGIISSLDRTVRSPTGKLMRGLVQTDASINPGNSGGPLIDLDGKLIGITTAILSQSGDSAGIGFAVPINQLRRILPELIKTGKVLRPYVGWVLADTNHGPMVQRVLPNTPAEQAGITPFERAVSGAFLRGFIRDFEGADLVYAINDERVKSSEEVEQRVASADHDKEIEVTLRRGGINGAQRKVRVSPVLR